MTITKETERRRSYCWAEDDEFKPYSYCQRTRQLTAGTRDEGVYYRVRYCHAGPKGLNLMETVKRGQAYETMAEALEELRRNFRSWLGTRGRKERYRCVIIERSADGGKSYRHWLLGVSQCKHLFPYDRQKYLREEDGISYSQPRIVYDDRP